MEDEPLVRFAIADGLREAGACVIEAASADEAWQFLSASGESVDLIFTDNQMPGSMSGAELASRVSRSYPSVAIVVTSGNPVAGEWSGAVMKKPYPLAEVADDLVRLATANKSKGPGT